MIDKYIEVNQFLRPHEDGILIGETTPEHSPEATIQFFQEWTQDREIELDRCLPFSREYADIMDKRFVSYKEFEDAIKHDRESLSEDSFLHYRFYEFYLIDSYAKKRNIFTGITPDYEGYVRVLHKLKNPIITDFFLSSFRMKLPRDAMKRHTHIMSKTGQGKSNLIKIIIHQLLKEKRKQSIILIEPHGDLAKEVRDLAYQLKDPDRLVYIDPYLMKGKMPVFNPFDISDTSDENIDTYSQELSKTFEELLKDGTTLSGQMDAVLRPAISTLLRMKGTTLKDLQILMDLDDSREKDLLIKQGLKNPFVTHRTMFAKVWGGDKIPTNYKTTISSIYTKIQQLFNTNVFYNLVCGNHGKSTFDLEQLVNDGKIIIFNLSKGDMGSEASEAFGKFIVSYLQSIAFKRSKIAEQYRTPTFAIIDEFQNYVTPSITTILSEARKYGLHLILAHQSIGQITDTKLRDTLLGNTAIKIIGQSSKKTLKTMSDEMDMNLKEFRELRPFEFYIEAQSLKKKKKSKPYRVKPSKYLVKETKLFYQTLDEKARVKKMQLEKYYTGLGKPKKRSFIDQKKEREPQERKSGAGPKFKL